MLTIAFAVLMIVVFGKLAIFAFKATWGIAKILLSVVFLPIIIIGFFISGLLYIAFPILIVVGIIALIKSVAT